MEQKLYSSKPPVFDLYLNSTHTNLANIINGKGNNQRVYITETISISTLQDITVSGLRMSFYPGAYITTSSDGLASLLQFSGNNFVIENLSIKTTLNAQSMVRFSASGIVSGMDLIHDGLGKTITNALVIYPNTSINASGKIQIINGTVSNNFLDYDNKSIININGTVASNELKADTTLYKSGEGTP